METKVPCFIMPCYDYMEKDCLNKGLFVRKETALPFLRTIKKGDIGFLQNVDTDELLGIFQALDEAQLDINPDITWNGLYRAQVRVKLINELQRVKQAESKLQEIVQLRQIKGKHVYKVPSQSTYGPNITEKILSLFESTDKEEKNLRDLIADLRAYVQGTNHKYENNYKTGIITHPIPYFGNPENAEVITVGVNPSVTEFQNRQWPTVISDQYLESRLNNYFNLPDLSPHPWFEKWEESLQLLGYTYHKNAAHMDLSPRATINLRDIPDKHLFEEMIVCDLTWFFKFLQLFKSVKLLLIAGAVTNDLYINQFIAKNALTCDSQLTGSLELPPGHAKTSKHTLITPYTRLPVFFCSVGPSSNNRDLLVERISENREYLMQLLER